MQRTSIFITSLCVFTQVAANPNEAPAPTGAEGGAKGDGGGGGGGGGGRGGGSAKSSSRESAIAAGGYMEAGGRVQALPTQPGKQGMVGAGALGRDTCRTSFVPVGGWFKVLSS